MSNGPHETRRNHDRDGANPAPDADGPRVPTQSPDGDRQLQQDHAPPTHAASAGEQELCEPPDPDAEALRELAEWAGLNQRDALDRRVLTRHIDRCGRIDYERLSDRALAALASLRGLDLKRPTDRTTIMAALRSGEGLRQRLRRKRRALVAWMIAKLTGLESDAASGGTDAEQTQQNASRPKENIREHIVEHGVVKGIATTLRSAADDYIRQKLDEIEQRIDRKLDEIDRRLQEWRDREIRTRLRIIKITLAASVLVAALSLLYKILVE